jgi:AcrR family transcriptional regulator
VEPIAEGSITLRERSRRAVQQEVSALAIRLFAAHGFEAVTTTQIAQAAGISPRSFFRYFPTKEDLVVGSLSESGKRVRDALVARPESEGAWDALRMAVRELIENSVYPTTDLEAVTRIIIETPSIRSRQLEKNQEWEDLLAPNLSERLRASGIANGASAEDVARVMVAATMTAMRITTQRWLESGTREDPLTIFDDLFAAVRAS